MFSIAIVTGTLIKKIAKKLPQEWKIYKINSDFQT
jgi:hypothetical protein